jgi:DNA-binding NarL/FixJ family response regulator
MTIISSEPKSPGSSARTENSHEAERERDRPKAAERQAELEPPPIRVMIADSEAIFRVGVARILAVESDLEVVAQAETLQQALLAVANTATDVILFEAALSPTPAEALSEVIRRARPGAQVVVVTVRTEREETVDFLRRGVRGILPRAVSPELLVRCVRKVAAGETWLDKQGVNWVIEAYRNQALHGNAPKQQLRLSEKELLIISGVTQGLKNKDIAHEIGTTEQVVKNYLRKIYDKLQVMDRLELALYSMHHRLLDDYVRGNEGRPALEIQVGRAISRRAASASVVESPYPETGQKEPQNGSDNS